MIANPAISSERFKQYQVLFLIFAVSVTVFLFVSKSSNWKPGFGFASPSVTSADDVDAALQRTAAAALGSREGTIIVMDPETGRIRAVVNPGTAFGQAYAPGSTIKPFAALAALRSHLIDEDSRMLCRERYAHNEVETACSHTKDLPPLGPASAIAYSCNYYFGRLGEGLREDEFRATLSSFGFGRRTGINMKDEAAGSIGSGKWTPYAALGEGAYTQVTPGQLISAYAALVNGGKLFQPEIAGANNFRPATFQKIEIDEPDRAALVMGMLGAVQFGTAKRAAIQSSPLYVLGKTGTSTPSRGFRTQGWFVGFAASTEPSGIPPESMRLAVLVFVKRAHGADAAAMAQPIFEEFSRLAGEEEKKGQGRKGARGEDLKTTEVNSPDSSRQSNSQSSVRVHLVRENLTLDLPFEDYVLGVVATEGSIEDQPEALRALALAARTYALKNRGRHQHEGFDFCTTTHCQRFEPGRSPTVREGSVTQPPVCDSPLIISAVRSTTAEILLDHRGQVADTYFGASCGGSTANIQTLWGGKRLTHLSGVPDDYCSTMPHHEWLDVIPRSRLLAALNSDPRTSIGSRLDDLIVIRRDASGRAELISLQGEQRKIVRGWDFKIIVGRALGWNKLKSSKFAITRSGHDFVFRGSGFGHGLGLCQEGAHVMAQRGMSYRNILEHYFPGTTIGRMSDAAHLDTSWKADLLPSSSTRLSSALVSYSNQQRNLSSENFRLTYPAQVDRRDAELVLRTLEATRADLTRRIFAASIPTRVSTIDVHINNTTGDFVGRTGQPWWAAAATRGNHIDLQPLAVLKRHRMLTTTLRHELAHAFIHAAGHGRTPRWLNEGFAIYLAGEGKTILRDAPPGRSPTVREGSLSTEELESKLTQPVSADEMRALYAAAYREVSRIVKVEGEAKVWRRVATY